MGKIIDADKLCEALDEAGIAYDPIVGNIIGTAKEAVVRCKNCIYRESLEDCDHHDADPEGYCAWGKEIEMDEKDRLIQELRRENEALLIQNERLNEIIEAVRQKMIDAERGMPSDECSVS